MSAIFFMRNPYKKFQNSSMRVSKVMLCIKKHDERKNERTTRSNMPLQLLRSWGVGGIKKKKKKKKKKKHSLRVCYLCGTSDTYMEAAHLWSPRFDWLRRQRRHCTSLHILYSQELHCPLTDLLDTNALTCLSRHRRVRHNPINHVGTLNYYLIFVWIMVNFLSRWNRRSVWVSHCN